MNKNFWRNVLSNSIGGLIVLILYQQRLIDFINSDIIRVLVTFVILSLISLLMSLSRLSLLNPWFNKLSKKEKAMIDELLDRNFKD